MINPERKSWDKIIRKKNNECHIFHHDFQTNEIIGCSLKEMKNGIAAGFDEILIEQIEQIEHFGLGGRRWLLQLLNTCFHRKCVPKR